MPEEVVSDDTVIDDTDAEVVTGEASVDDEAVVEEESDTEVITEEPVEEEVTADDPEPVADEPQADPEVATITAQTENGPVTLTVEKNVPVERPQVVQQGGNVVYEISAEGIGAPNTLAIYRKQQEVPGYTLPQELVAAVGLDEYLGDAQTARVTLALTPEFLASVASGFNPPEDCEGEAFLQADGLRMTPEEVRAGFSQLTEQGQLSATGKLDGGLQLDNLAAETDGCDVVVEEPPVEEPPAEEPPVVDEPTPCPEGTTGESLETGCLIPPISVERPPVEEPPAEEPPLTELPKTGPASLLAQLGLATGLIGGGSGLVLAGRLGKRQSSNGLNLVSSAAGDDNAVAARRNGKGKNRDKVKAGRKANVQRLMRQRGK